MDKTHPPYSLKDIVLYALKLGATGFGGPIALVGYMFRDLVEKRKWISEEDYKESPSNIHTLKTDRVDDIILSFYSPR